MLYSDWISQTIRLWHSGKEAEVEMDVGPLPTHLDGVKCKGKCSVELVTRYNTDLDNTIAPSSSPANANNKGNDNNYDERKQALEGSSKTSSSASRAVMYTDSNGREMQRRIQDSRATWDLKVKWIELVLLALFLFLLQSRLASLFS